MTLAKLALCGGFELLPSCFPASWSCRFSRHHHVHQSVVRVQRQLQ